MPPRSPYLQKREGVSFYVCPHDQQEYDSLGQLKRHMEVEHGGFTESEIGEATPQAPRTETPPGDTTATFPRKVSKKNRELNEKLNECISLIAQRIMSGLKPEQKERLQVLKGDLLVNALGFDFDFDKGLIPLHSKFWLVTMLLLTQAEAWVPDAAGSQIVAILKARKDGKGEAESEEVKP